jgi:hypothetical protein
MEPSGGLERPYFMVGGCFVLPGWTQGGRAMRQIGRLVLSSALAMALALPAVAEDEPPPFPKPSALVGSSLEWCPEVPEVKADQSLFGDRPIYAGNAPTGKIQRWARQQPGYADLWIDRDNYGWVVVAFAQDAAKRQADIERRFPELGAVAVAVEHSKKDLKQARRRVSREVIPLLKEQGLEEWSLWDDPSRNVVGLGAGVLTDERVALLEAKIGDDPVCISGSDPSWLVPDGPQPTAGEGWTLIGQQRSDAGPFYRTGLASDRRQLEALWSEARMDGDAPAVDFERDVVLWFAEPHGSTCDLLRLDDIVIDHEAALIHPLIVMPDDPTFCTDDLSGAYQYLVAVERERLPAAPFAIQLDPEWAGEDRVVVEADLRVPGSTAADDQIPQRELPLRETAIRSGDIVEAGYRFPYLLNVRCGVGYLGELNDIHWVSEETAVPDAWLPKVSDDGEIILSVLLDDGVSPRVTARTSGHSVRYEPRREAPPSACGT